MKKILIKCGGELLEEEATRRRLAQDVHTLVQAGYAIVLCHGGGPQITRNMEKANLKAHFVRGKRVTDAETLQIIQNTLLGEISLPFVSALQGAGLSALGLHGADCALLEVRAADLELGFVGNVQNVRSDVLLKLLHLGFTPLISCIGPDSQGQLYNVNADDVASALAQAITADILVLLSNVNGIYRNYPDPDSRIAKLSASECRELLASSALSAGMIPKVQAALHALECGVKDVRILNGFQEHALSKSILAQRNLGGTCLFA